MKKSYSTEIRGLLETLDILASAHNVEYKIIYEYRYNWENKRCQLKRKVIVFNNNSPVATEWFRNDLEIIQYISKELATWSNIDKGIK